MPSSSAVTRTRPSLLTLTENPGVATASVEGEMTAGRPSATENSSARTRTWEPEPDELLVARLLALARTDLSCSQLRSARQWTLRSATSPHMRSQSCCFMVVLYGWISLQSNSTERAFSAWAA